MSAAHRAPAHATILVLSHLRWDFVTQRPQHLLSRAAKDGFDVFYVEEPIFEGSVFAERRVDRGGVTVIQPLVPEGADPIAVESHCRRIVNAAARRAARPIWLWVYSPTQLPLARDVAPDRVIFDKMDELSAFAFAPPELRQREAALMARADVVFTGGQAMYEAAVGRHQNLHCFPSSIDTAHFAAARSKAVPDPIDQAAIKNPRIGFFGVIDERFDIELLRSVAAERREWAFIMIGPTAKIDPANLPRAENIHWLGGKKYAELPAYLAHWDVGWMPFAINDATRFISPTKTPEFLAAGLPVVSTPIRDVVRPYGEEGLVQIAANAEETVAAIEAALAPPDPAWRKAVDRRLAAGSWDRTWAAMRDLAAAPARTAREVVHA